MKHSTAFFKLSVMAILTSTLATLSTSCVSEDAYIRKENEANYATSDAYYSRQRALDAEAKARRDSERVEYYKDLNNRRSSAPRRSGEFEPMR